MLGRGDQLERIPQSPPDGDIQHRHRRTRPAGSFEQAVNEQVLRPGEVEAIGVILRWDLVRVITNAKVLLEGHGHHEHGELAPGVVVLLRILLETVAVPVRLVGHVRRPGVEFGEQGLAVDALGAGEALGADEVHRRDVDLGQVALGQVDEFLERQRLLGYLRIRPGRARLDRGREGQHKDARSVRYDTHYPHDSPQ